MPDQINSDHLRKALDSQGVMDPMIRAGLAAIAMGESKMQGHTERGYSRTSNTRIREVFAARVAELSDTELNTLKAVDEDFFNWVYGSQFQSIHHLGNTGDDDGFNFRGRGFIQLTGRSNYTRYSEMIGRPDILDEPDRANDPELAAQLAVAYILDRFDGGDFDDLMAAVGNNTPDIKATKRAFFEQFMTSGEFAATAGSSSAGIAIGTLRRRDKGPAVKALQLALIAAGFDCGPRGADADFGGATEDAVAAFQTARGLLVTRVADDATRAALGLPA
jgi:predicted chitinase